MSTLIEQYQHALVEFGRRVEEVGDDQWSAPTPCVDWDVRALVAHVVDECRWAPYLLSGGTVADAGDRFAGDPLGDDPKAAWRSASEQARAAFAADGALDHTVSLSYGETSARDYIWEMTVDATVHAWDLARGIGADDRLDPELVRRIHTEAEKDVEARSATGLFDPPVPVAAHADLQTRMLSLFGRRA
ncbi:MAG TPA: TIGR03086 family metal-binding protein [Actinomycetes bacterium]|nr:TIGR03086 family metal-binding protein [Actinomycetes bacterium]